MIPESDIIVIGAGPAGYTAAIRAGQLGKSVTIVEKQHIGGECLNFGCVPSKAFISAADFYHKIRTDASTMGIDVEHAQVKMARLQQWIEKVTKRLTYGVKQLLTSQDVDILRGTAQLLDDHTVQIDQEGGTKTITAKNIIIATGAEFRSLEGFPIDEDEILSARGILDLVQVPDDLVIIGAGYIGVELGTAFAKLGAHVKYIEIMPEIMPTMDQSLVQDVKRTLNELDAELYTESKAKSLTRESGKLKITVETPNGKEALTGDKVLVSIGKQASTGTLLEHVEINTDEQGFISVDDQMHTNVPHIYAVGDCTGEPFLAHRAMKQGIIAAEVIADLPASFDYRAIPTAAFTDPEIGTVGMLEDEAKNAGYDVITAKASFKASGRALTLLQTEGFVKVVVDKESNVLLGVQIVGPNATELISEAALAIEMGATAEDLGWTIHPHPTLPEMIMEAAEAAMGKAIHVANPHQQEE